MKKKVLIIVDVQNDFCPGGSLAVADGEKIISNINLLSNSGLFDMIIASQDWHPADHISFASQHAGKRSFETIVVDYGTQTLWPDHCVQGTHGADFHPRLDQKPIHFIVRKGYRKNVDSYSAFLENDRIISTKLSKLIEPYDFEVHIVGIATDVCVFNTAIDAMSYGVVTDGKVFVIEDACAGVTPGGTEKALEQLIRVGVRLIKTNRLA